jgi:hypothetical protein
VWRGTALQHQIVDGGARRLPAWRFHDSSLCSAFLFFNPDLSLARKFRPGGKMAVADELQDATCGYHG